ncbi:MAG: hypothetical protein ACK4SQ_07795 [Allorhizobium sp.]
MIKDRDGEWIANAPHTRDLIARLIDSGITDAAELTGLVELSGGKRYDPALASSHYLGVWSCIHRPT